MALPHPPADIELKNIIDKLAQFVARNGSEFEQMTKNKQKDNPKFSFLFGGEWYNYYQYKVTTEQAILKVKAAAQNAMANQQPPMGGYNSGSSNQGNPPPINPLQMMNSNPNWHVTQQPPPQQQPNAIPLNPSLQLTTILEQQNVLQQQITQSEQNLAAQHASLMQSQEALIEDAIRKYQFENLSQKAIENGIDLNDLDSVLQPIIDSCTKDSISNGKAWILNHTSKRSQDIIAEYLLHKVISPGIPFVQKLHIIYLVNDVMHHCVRKSSDVLKKALEDIVVPMICNSWLCATTEQQEKLKKLINLWEAKNNYFSYDVIKKMKSPFESWKEYKEDLERIYDNVVGPVKMTTQSTYENYRAQHDVFVNHALVQIQSLESEKMQLERQQEEQRKIPMTNIPAPPPHLLCPENIPFDTPPPNIPPPPFMNPPMPDLSHLPPELLPDFSRPPPGFQPAEHAMEDLIPSVPYYDLPAGLIVNLIKIEDSGYKPLDPKKLRLPAALPPSERLMQAVEAFYQKNYSGTNTRERLILDADGWEKLGLYEYYKAKNAAKKQKDLEIEAGLREKSRSPSPILREKSRSKSPKKKRVYRSKSPSPVDKERRSRSRSPKRSNGKKSPRRSRRRSRSRTPSPPRARSPSPSFVPFARTQEEKLDESNRGHQLLKKMGWGGAGLGSKEQGIADPISGGDVRDRVDQYKGVGVNLHDPFESFRKNKGKAFITRMKARAEERAAEH